MQSLGRILMVGWLLAGAAHALYHGQGVTAFPIADGAIKVDGKPESIWREISANSGGKSQIQFNDYGKVVLLDPVAVRNAPPAQHFLAPSTGSVTLLAAYDRTFLYFFFLVRENNTFNPSTCSTADLWKAHAVDVYVDPNAWDTTQYRAYFSTDADEASYGTSPKTLQVSKPAWPGDTRKYFRDRTVGNRFELRAASSQLQAICSTRTLSDGNTLGVEIKVPMPTPGDFAAGKSMFISWGYNHYPVESGLPCDSLPIAYRFAKHYKTYADFPKPPGWLEGDSTHYDPLRSYDGWGRFELANTSAVTGSRCIGSVADTTWDLDLWYSACRSQTTTLRPERSVLHSAGAAAESRAAFGRDLRGRLRPRGSDALFIFPEAASPLRTIAP